MKQFSRAGVRIKGSMGPNKVAKHRHGVGAPHDTQHGEDSRVSRLHAMPVVFHVSFEWAVFRCARVSSNVSNVQRRRIYGGGVAISKPSILTPAEGCASIRSAIHHSGLYPQSAIPLIRRIAARESLPPS
jgi:hypothetical protein